jgi:dUTP pyrophosphatase
VDVGARASVFIHGNQTWDTVSLCGNPLRSQPNYFECTRWSPPMSYRMLHTIRRLMCDKFSVLCTMAELNAKQEREELRMKVNVRIKKASPDVNLPKYQSDLAAGFDIEAHISTPVVIPIGERRLIGTGLHFQLPPDFELQLRPRSGLAINHGITLTNAPATIDADFTGEVRVIVENRGNTPFVVENGMRICQGVINKVEKAHFSIVEELSETARGTGGFGSTSV